MAKAHTTDGWTNPEVRFERSDVNLRTVATIGVVASVVVAVVSVFATWLGLVFLKDEDRRKRTTLPPAAVDRDRLPPQPRLEALEDLRQGKVGIWPQRARTHFRDQEELLRKGNPRAGVLAIDEAMRQLAGHLPAEKRRPPAGSGVPLPSKASSGRVETGGR